MVIEIEQLETDDRQWAVELLANAFQGKLPTSKLFAGDRAARKLEFFFSCMWRYCARYGECHGNRQAVALWSIPDCTRMTAWRTFRSGFFSSPFVMGMTDFKRFAAYGKRTAAAHAKAISEPHYHLLMLATDPSQRGSGLGSKLVESMIQKCDREMVPIYLETQNESNIGFYKRFGFEVVSETPISECDLTNWAMVRRPA